MLKNVNIHPDIVNHSLLQKLFTVIKYIRNKYIAQESTFNREGKTMLDNSSLCSQSFKPIRQNRLSVAKVSFLLDWSYGSINPHLKFAIRHHLERQRGIIGAVFTETKTNELNVNYDPGVIKPDEIKDILECPQLSLQSA